MPRKMLLVKIVNDLEDGINNLLNRVNKSRGRYYKFLLGLDGGANFDNRQKWQKTQSRKMPVKIDLRQLKCDTRALSSRLTPEIGIYRFLTVLPEMVISAGFRLSIGSSEHRGSWSSEHCAAARQVGLVGPVSLRS